MARPISMWKSSSWPGIRAHAPAREVWVSTTGPPGKSLLYHVKRSLLILELNSENIILPLLAGMVAVLVHAWFLSSVSDCFFPDSFAGCFSFPRHWMWNSQCLTLGCLLFSLYTICQFSFIPRSHASGTMSILTASEFFIFPLNFSRSSHSFSIWNSQKSPQNKHLKTCLLSQIWVSSMSPQLKEWLAVPSVRCGDQVSKSFLALTPPSTFMSLHGLWGFASNLSISLSTLWSILYSLFSHRPLLVLLERVLTWALIFQRKSSAVVADLWTHSGLVERSIEGRILKLFCKIQGREQFLMTTKINDSITKASTFEVMGIPDSFLKKKKNPARTTVWSWK